MSLPRWMSLVQIDIAGCAHCVPGVFIASNKAVLGISSLWVVGCTGSWPRSHAEQEVPSQDFRASVLSVSFSAFLK